MTKRIVVEFLMDDEDFEDHGPRLLELDNQYRPNENKRDPANLIHQAAAIVQAFCFDDGQMDGVFLVRRVEEVDTIIAHEAQVSGNVTVTFSADQFRVLQQVNDDYLSMIMGNGDLSDDDDDKLSELVAIIGYPNKEG